MFNVMQHSLYSNFMNIIQVLYLIFISKYFKLEFSPEKCTFLILSQPCKSEECQKNHYYISSELDLFEKAPLLFGA